MGGGYTLEVVPDLETTFLNFSIHVPPLRNLQIFKEKHRKFSENTKNAVFSVYFVYWVLEGVSKPKNVTKPPVFGVEKSKKSISEA